MTAKELKASILQLAITGKLVKQDPNDEPAGVLLERIRAEKAKLVKAGKIKKDKNPSEIVVGSDGALYEKFEPDELVDISDELPVEIPMSWKWVRLSDVTEFLHRGKSPVYAPSSNCPMFAQKCNQWDGIHLEKCKFCSADKYNSYPEEYHLRDYDVVVNSTGTGTLGRVGIFFEDHLRNFGFKSIVPDSHVTIIRTSDKTLNRFIYYYLRSEKLWKWMNEIADGSTKQKELYTSTLSDLLIPVPPTNEQIRIMAKIEKLMPLVERFGELEDRRLQLDADLPLALEKSILQEAIQGKLVKQNPNDEPANELLKRVAAERKALVKAGKIKRDKDESVIFRGSDRLTYETRNGETVCIEDDLPFKIPESWAWARLGAVLLPMTSKKPKGETFEYIDIDAIDNKTHSVRASKTLPVNGATSRASREVKPGDVLFSMVRPYLRNIALITEQHENCIASTGFYVCRPTAQLHSPFLYYLMLSEYVVMGLNEKMKGLNSPGITTGDLQHFLVPIPPLHEQRRIVTKISKLKSMIRELVNL